MDFKLLKEYMDEGYIIPPIYELDTIEHLEGIKAVDLDDTLIEDIVLSLNIFESNIFEPGYLVLLKWNKPYRITLENIKDILGYNEESHASYEDWLNLMYLEDYNSNSLVIPNISKSGEEFHSDYLFENESHIIRYVLRYIKYQFEKEEKIDISKLKTFIKDVTILKEDKNYKVDDETLLILVDNLSEIGYFNPSIISKKMKDYFINNLEYLVSKNNPKAMEILGYQYYQDTVFYSYDPYKSLDLLEKSYNLTQNPDLTRPLGYMYYYGRTTNGIPNKEKAFQYFAIGHFAGQYYECSYKLADCYMKGYGTPISQKAAYSIVDNIYGPCKEAFLNGRDGKYADVALRLGSYHENAVNVEKSNIDAYRLYLEARCAIKDRMNKEDYVGDRSVAVAISNNIKRLQNEFYNEEREIKNNGYLLNKEYFAIYKDHEISTSLYGDNYIKIEITPKKYKYELFCDHNIGYSEIYESINYLVKIKEIGAAINFINHKNNLHSLAIDSKALYIFYFDEISDEVQRMDFEIEETIYLPKTLSTLEKEYKVVGVSFPNSDKTYDYLCNERNVNAGDTLFVHAKGETKSVTVISVNYVYEDELPTPLNKMAIAFKNNKNN